MWHIAGTQTAVAWCDDRVLVGPVSDELSGPDRGDPGLWPFNRVLRALGATRGDAIDEFEAVGLNLFRSTEDWVKIAAR
jgi:hypothetical protein